ncbi:lactate utilization protein [Tepidibacter aestuarii]|uniref:lactate utilization protein n=1 Tax=Tepidibacter aestuarii TaxID=2925782 RepID=UPI0020BD6481|nr:lactate utilization protein [Tepidibacter aestuarii]CAH2215370.1 LUD_dom domain-containing protein [Tepidibacter aestuarii]
MDKNINFVIEKKVERTIQNLEKNNISGYFVQTEEKALNKIKELINEGDTVSVGGSMTLFEIKAIELLRNENYNFIDRYEENLTSEEIKDINRKSFFSNVFLTSSNAITENGELYNVDGRGSRVAPMLYGPDKVIVVVGINKIVRDLNEAIMRNKELAAPANAKRLNKDTPCANVGHCVDCNSKNRICNKYVLIKRDMDLERIHVIIVNKELGY